jgi:hypothetical protein
MKLLNWWRERSPHEKWMVALIAMLLVCIAVRWTWVSSEIGNAFRERFTAPAHQTAPADSLRID